MKYLKNKIIWLLTAIGLIGIAYASLGGDIQTSVNYVDKGTYLETEFVQTIADSGVSKAELQKNEPRVILTKWNDEVRMGVKYKGIPADTVGVLNGEVMEWKGATEEMHAYPLATSTQMTDGGFEIEIVLNSKPASNIFEFQIDGYENLDFFYQPALTQQEIDDGAVRPDNVIGSYAVYHKTKANHRIGSINYATGKAFHIYRIKVIDALGDWIWADQNINAVTGKWTIIIDQIWLNNANYPIKL